MRRSVLSGAALALVAAGLTATNLTTYRHRSWVDDLYDDFPDDPPPPRPRPPAQTGPVIDTTPLSKRAKRRMRARAGGAT